MKETKPGSSASEIRSRLGRRERQILDILFRLGRATAVDVMNNLPDPPGYASVRKWLSLMEGKGLVVHEKEGKRFVYRAAIARDKAKQGALEHLAATFFEGSKVRAAAALISESESEISEEDRKMLLELIDSTKHRGR